MRLSSRKSSDRQMDGPSGRALAPVRSVRSVPRHLGMGGCASKRTGNGAVQVTCLCRGSAGKFHAKRRPTPRLCGRHHQSCATCGTLPTGNTPEGRHPRVTCIQSFGRHTLGGVPPIRRRAPWRSTPRPHTRDGEYVAVAVGIGERPREVSGPPSVGDEHRTPRDTGGVGMGRPSFDAHHVDTRHPGVRFLYPFARWRTCAWFDGVD